MRYEEWFTHPDLGCQWYLVASLSGLTAWNYPLGCASSSIQKYKRTFSKSPTRAARASRAARAAHCRQKIRIFDRVFCQRDQAFDGGDDGKQPPAGTLLGTTSTSRRSVRQQGHLLQRRAVCQLTTVIYRLVEASVLVLFDLSQSIFQPFQIGCVLFLATTAVNICFNLFKPFESFLTTMGNCLSGAPAQLIENCDGGEEAYHKRYMEGDVLGEGEFGQVRLVHDMTQNKNQNAPYASKLLRKGVVFKDNTLYSPIKVSCFRDYRVEYVRGNIVSLIVLCLKQINSRKSCVARWKSFRSLPGSTIASKW
jgi:hypothetical protein